MPFKINRITSAEFDAMRDEWNQLLDRSACDSVFLRWEWMHTWWGLFNRNRKLFILTASSNGRLVGVAPFYVERSGPWNKRTLKFCSEELSPDYLDLIAEPGQEAEVAREIVKYLIQSAGEWDVLSLDNLRAESPLLTDPTMFMGYRHTVNVSNQCPYIKIETSFDDYFKERRELASFSFKKKLNYLFDQKKVEHRITSDEESLDKGLNGLFLLHEKRAQQKNMQSNILSPDVRRFHHEVSRQFFKEQILSLHMLYEGETPISAYYAYIYKNKAFLFQTGFDPAWSKWSAGAVLLHFCIQRAFQDGLREFDFLKGLEGYKSLWNNAVRDEMILTVYNTNLRGSLGRAAFEIKSVLRSFKQGLVKRLAPTNAG